MSPFESAQQEEQSEPTEEANAESREGAPEGDYSREFERRMLVVEAVDPKDYTAEMFKQDMTYLDTWMRYELGRFQWLLGQHKAELGRRSQEAKDFEEKQQVVAWNKETIRQLNEELQRKKEEIWAFQDRVRKTYQSKQAPEQEEEENTTEDEEAKEEPREEENERSRTDSHRQEEPPPRKEKEKTIDSEQIIQIAIDGLGITREEYAVLTGRIHTLPSDHLWALLKLVLKVENTDRKSMRSAYYELIKELHPDTGGTEFEKAVKSAKIQVVNNLYGEYKKRYR